MKFQLALIQACNEADLVGDLVPPVKHLEDEGKYIHFVVEAWSTWKYSFRKSDGRYIRESTALNGVGIDEETLVSRIVEQQKSFKTFLDARNKAIQEAGGNVRRVVVLDREEGKMLVVPQRVVDAWGGRNHFFQVWVGNGTRPMTWEAFDASEAVGFTRTYHNAQNITKVDVILKSDWELQYQQEQKKRGAK